MFTRVNVDPNYYCSSCSGSSFIPLRRAAELCDAVPKEAFTLCTSSKTNWLAAVYFTRSQLSPQAPLSGRGALRRGPERGLFAEILPIFPGIRMGGGPLTYAIQILTNFFFGRRRLKKRTEKTFPNCSNFHGAFTELSRSSQGSAGIGRGRYQFRQTLHAPRCPLF